MSYEKIQITLREAARELEAFLHSCNEHTQHQSSVIFVKVWKLISEDLMPLVDAAHEEMSTDKKEASTMIDLLQAKILEKEREKEKVQNECGLFQQIL